MTIIYAYVVCVYKTGVVHNITGVADMNIFANYTDKYNYTKSQNVYFMIFTI